MESEVNARYGAAALKREEALCCPVEYDARYLKAIPEEVLRRDYGCGDPSRHLRPGDTVLDLGSGGGKICFIAAQVVGKEGRVIGVDMNLEMLALARRSAPLVAERIGYANVTFHRGRIQDLKLSVDRLEEWLAARPVRSAEDLVAMEELCDRLRSEDPLIADCSVDVVVSNCVLNLVRSAQKQELLSEIHRVIRPGGRIAISDIVSDRPVPEQLRADPELWSGCISGAFEEGELLEGLERVGFLGITVAERATEPFASLEGIDFRSITVTAARAGGETLEGDPSAGAGRGSCC